MLRCLIVLCLAFGAPLAHAWNAAGHRLVALIAWQQLSPSSRQAIDDMLRRHPDLERWQQKAHSSDTMHLFAEASTWPDDIRHDPRFFDESREPATPQLPGLPDTARHKRWHYVDLGLDGKAHAGELDRQIERLSQLLRSTANAEEKAYALPWLLHLVADIHQPLHVGRPGDEGGNRVEIENPFNKRQPFSSLHSYWDDLPGPPWLRGKRLEENAAWLIETFPPPRQGNVRQWRDESHRLLDTAYPETTGSLLPLINEEFHQQSRATAQRRLVDAGYRLAQLLEKHLATRVSRETP